MYIHVDFVVDKLRTSNLDVDQELTLKIISVTIIDMVKLSKLSMDVIDDGS